MIDMANKKYYLVLTKDEVRVLYNLAFEGAGTMYKGVFNAEKYGVFSEKEREKLCKRFFKVVGEKHVKLLENLYKFTKGIVEPEFEKHQLKYQEK